MAHMLELPDTIYMALRRAATQSGTTVSDWIAARVSEASGQAVLPASESDIQFANDRLDACIVDYGCVEGIDNDRIDADLASQYAGVHLVSHGPQEGFRLLL